MLLMIGLRTLRIQLEEQTLIYPSLLQNQAACTKDQQYSILGILYCGAPRGYTAVLRWGGVIWLRRGDMVPKTDPWPLHMQDTWATSLAALESSIQPTYHCLWQGTKFQY